MDRLKFLAAACLLVAALLLGTGPASAQYVGHPGQAPAAGAFDQGPVSPASYSGTQVLGQQFVRTEGGGFLASTGADIAELTLFGLALTGLGVVLVRRRHPSRRPLSA